jgi:hypothetical protein
LRVFVTTALKSGQCPVDLHCRKADRATLPFLDYLLAR